MTAPAAGPSGRGDGATPGPYLRQGRTVYVLTENTGRWRLGMPNMVNRWYAQVQPHDGCSSAEAEAVAQLFAAAPEMAAALQGMVDAFERPSLQPFLRAEDLAALDAARQAHAPAARAAEADCGL